MSWTARLVVAAALAGASTLRLPPEQARRASASIVIVTGLQATTPVPTLMEGPQNTLANHEIADHLFLRLAGMGPGLVTAGDHGFVPLLAKAWTRRDSLTLVFDLDPRARWHDGAPVTARDVVFTMSRAREREISPRLANVMRRIAGVETEGDRRVVVRFSEVYAEQLYDATFHCAILPAHLLADLPPTREAWASFAARPVGSGPYRWVRRVEGEFIELAANEDFFLGRPAITRLIVRVAVSADARINLLLAGEADAIDNIPPPLTNIARVEAARHLRVVPVPSNNLGYLLFNHRNPADRDRPHPILADRDVRRALILALDRELLVRAVLGRYGDVPFGPVSSQLWIRHGAPEPARQDQSTARKLLAGRGWVDRDRDGTRENRTGEPLALRLVVSSSSDTRMQMATIVQEQLRQVGVRLELVRVEPAVWLERRAAGNFDIDFSSASLDPSPSGLVFSWTCDGPGNAGRYCDRGADSLLYRAMASPVADRRLWHQFLRRVEENAPAAFLYSQTFVFGVHRRFHEVTIRPESSWIALWRWPAPRT
ncbi:MAG TPA: ABC transporter substrate-binding protein [Gemmatimonadales bacterium]|nr:ABC transporter substrate-binding protein [Gemmatimonadales bacterium]